MHGAIRECRCQSLKSAIGRSIFGCTLKDISVIIERIELAVSYDPIGGFHLWNRLNSHFTSMIPRLKGGCPIAPKSWLDITHIIAFIFLSVQKSQTCHELERLKSTLIIDRTY